MRQGCITEDEPEVFNSFLFNIKEKYNNKEIWAIIIKEGINLINNIDNPKSKVTVQEAYSFLNEQHH